MLQGATDHLQEVVRVYTVSTGTIAVDLCDLCWAF